MAQVIRSLPLVTEEWSSNHEPIKSQIFHTLPTICHRCNLDVWALAQSRGDRHRSFVTPERVLSEYSENLIDFFLIVRYIF